MPAVCLPNQGLRIIAKCSACPYQRELSKRCSSGELLEATVVIQIMLLVSLIELVVNALAPHEGRSFVFVFVKLKLFNPLFLDLI